MKQILDTGIDVDAQADWVFTPLEIACKSKCFKVATCLLERGAEYRELPSEYMDWLVEEATELLENSYKEESQEVFQLRLPPFHF